ncbi:hypothetical protein [Pseudomonas sp. Irchel 3E13]|uniref:hypothetical protein n=1 Tax=Pseudomonas sp. Irchel 3E13 TaxID=2008975 RepID=UPI000BA4020D|nr:hypothetical protein [Pseudomonas sp. Irchel 3E13]
MLCLVTDHQGDEPDILSPLVHGDFEIRTLAGQVLKTFLAPASGWTHESLQALADEHESITHDGADGYLGGKWMGSTEI